MKCLILYGDGIVTSGGITVCSVYTQNPYHIVVGILVTSLWIWNTESDKVLSDKHTISLAYIKFCFYVVDFFFFFHFICTQYLFASVWLLYVWILGPFFKALEIYLCEMLQIKAKMRMRTFQFYLHTKSIRLEIVSMVWHTWMQCDGGISFSHRRVNTVRGVV